MTRKHLQNALNDHHLFEQLQSRTPVIFLDYDGTLTPIVDRPEKALLSEGMRSILKRLSERYTVAVISGRDREDVRQRVGIEELYYAGSHGFDISGPGGMEKQNEEARALLPVLDEAEQKLHEKLGKIEGCQVERKRYSIAVHYRNAAEAEVPRIKRIAAETGDAYSSLRQNEGKMIVELQPDIEWDKGHAVLWLMNELDADQEPYLPLYLGDDLTDEHAFDALRGKGIGILVGHHGHETQADYVLKDTEEAEAFLKKLM